MTGSNVAVAGVQLSVLGLFAVVWAGPNSVLPIAGFALVVVGTAMVGLELLDPL